MPAMYWLLSKQAPKQCANKPVKSLSLYSTSGTSNSQFPLLRWRGDLGVEPSAKTCKWHQQFAVAHFSWGFDPQISPSPVGEGV